MPYVIDTHAAIRRLEASGFHTPQAEALVETIGATRYDLVTKDYLDSKINSLRIQLMFFILVVAGLLKFLPG